MTLDEAVALLRESKNYVGYLPTRTDGIERAVSIQHRISAALAAHDAESERVEWRAYGGKDEDATIDGAHCILRYVGGSTGWHWDVYRTGLTRSLYDARAAAEKVARGMR